MIQLGRRFILCFSKETHEEVKEILFVGITLAKLREIFKDALSDEDDPMYDSFPIDERRAAQLSPYVSSPIELDKYDCFVECSSIPVEGPEGPPRRIKVRRLSSPMLIICDKNSKKELNAIYLNDGLTMEKIREIFRLPAEDELRGETAELRVAEEHATQLQEFSPQNVDLEKYDYLLECNAYDASILAADAGELSPGHKSAGD